MIKAGNGDVYMRSVLLNRLVLALAAVALVCFSARAADDKSAADDKKSLEKEIQEMNQKTGDDDWVQSKAIELLKNKDHLKKLIAVADDMGKLDAGSLKFNTALTLGLAATEIKEHKVALRFLQICDKQARKNERPDWLLQAFKVQWAIYFDEKRYEDAIKLCQDILDLKWDNMPERSKSQVRESLIKTMTRQGKVTEALKMTDELIKDEDLGWAFLELKGWVLNAAGRYEEAVKVYQDYIDHIEKEDRIKPEDQQRYIDQTRYVLSNVYIELGNVDKAVEMLKGLLERKPDNPTFNNDLGFVWADHDMHLDEAEKLIRKALDEDRKQRKADKDLSPEDDHDNAAYVDSLGWVLYKKKQYAEAKKYLLEAYCFFLYNTQPRLST